MLINKLKQGFRSSRLVQDASWSVVYKVAIMVLSFTQGVILARILQPEGRGVLALYLAPLSMSLPFANLGIRQASAFFLSKSNWSLSIVATLHLWFAFASSVVSIMVLGAIYFSQGLDNHLWILLVLATLPIKLFINSSFGIAMSSRMIREINTSQLIRVAIEFLLVVVFINFGRSGVSAYFPIYLASEGFSLFYVVHWLRKVDGYDLRGIKFAKDYIRPLVKKGISYAIPLYFVNIYYSIDILFLNHFVSKEQIGLYSVGVSFALMLWQFPAILSFVVFSYSVSSKDKRAFSDTIWRGTKTVMAYGLVVFILLIPLGKILIILLYGEEYALSYSVFLRILPGIYLMIAYKMLNGDLAGQGRPMVSFWVFAPVLILKLFLNWLIIPKYGVEGSALVSGVCYGITAIIYVIVFRKICLTTPTH